MEVMRKVGEGREVGLKRRVPNTTGVAQARAGRSCLVTSVLAATINDEVWRPCRQPRRLHWFNVFMDSKRHAAGLNSFIGGVRDGEDDWPWAPQVAGGRAGECGETQI